MSVKLIYINMPENEETHVGLTELVTFMRGFEHHHFIVNGLKLSICILNEDYLLIFFHFSRPNTLYE